MRLPAASRRMLGSLVQGRGRNVWDKLGGLPVPMCSVSHPTGGSRNGWGWGGGGDGLGAVAQILLKGSTLSP